MTIRTMAGIRGAILVLLVVLLALAVSTDTTQAHGDGTEIGRERSGPFEVGFRILPLLAMVGQLHVTITVEDPETGEMVTDARVRVVARHSEGEAEPILSPALNTEADPRWYDANFDLEHQGTWNFTVTVERGGETATMEQPVIVARRTRTGGLGSVGTAMFVLVTGAILGGAGWIAYQARRNQQRRKQG